jgi:hypothetical protein
MHRYFLTLVLLSVLAASVAVFLAEAKVLRCNPSDLSDEWYIALCADVHHDHGAILFDIDGALDGARDADVIFLGNSTTQIAFSNVEVIQFFEAIRMRFFVLGFGYGEAWKFTANAMARHNLKPHVLVVSATGLTGLWMDEELSAPAKHLLDHPVESYILTSIHSAYQSLQRHYCSGGTDSLICFRQGGVLYRSRKNGTWKVAPTGRYDAPPGERYFCNPKPDVPGPQLCASGHTVRPVPVAEKFTADEDAAAAQANMTKFLAAVDMPKECVVIIAVPRELDDRGKARKVPMRWASYTSTWIGLAFIRQTACISTLRALRFILDDYSRS